jgi:hypothetical protein
VRIPGDPPRDSSALIATEDVVRYAVEAGELVEQSVGVGWYEEHGNDVDRAALTLCRLRRASAGRHGSPGHGDDAVRDALDGVNTGAIVWLLSRAISYMDETGFPEAVEPWFPEEEPAA